MTFKGIFVPFQRGCAGAGLNADHIKTAGACRVFRVGGEKILCRMNQTTLLGSTYAFHRTDESAAAARANLDKHEGRVI